MQWQPPPDPYEQTEGWTGPVKKRSTTFVIGQNYRYKTSTTVLVRYNMQYIMRNILE